jgi:hypothetical protein
MSAYMLWLNASREKIKSDHPGISITDLSKKAGEIWKGMSKEKKEVSSGGKEGEQEGLCRGAGCVTCLHQSEGVFVLVAGVGPQG